MGIMGRPGLGPKCTGCSVVVVTNIVDRQFDPSSHSIPGHIGGQQCNIYARYVPHSMPRTKFSKIRTKRARWMDLIERIYRVQWANFLNENHLAKSFLGCGTDGHAKTCAVRLIWDVNINIMIARWFVCRS